MSDSAPIVIPTENVNDESVELLAWLVADQDPVQAGQVVAEIESSKATGEIVAPAAGILRHAHQVGDEVPVGGVLGYVTLGPAATPANEVPAPLPAPAAPTSVATPLETRFSAKAQELLKAHAADPSRFANRGLVRAEDVQAVIDGKPAPAASERANVPTPAPSTAAPSPPVVAAAGVPVRSEPLPRAKKVEARYLAAALRGGLPSVVTVACSTRGLRQALAAHPALGGQVSAIVIFEASRLLRTFPFFNAYCADGSVHYYQQVNIGFAVDAGHGLKVPVIRDADTRSLPEIAAQMQERVVEYLNDSLPIESLAGGTFTVSDLSGEGVFAFHPLINQGQSAMLGVGAEFFAPGSPEGLFNLILAFDHQISEGRAAARFLNELKRRIAAYESALRTAEEPYCERCFATMEELSRWNHYLMQTAGPRGTTRLICTRCAMGFA